LVCIISLSLAFDLFHRIDLSILMIAPCHGIYVHLIGGYDKEDKATRAYDLAALKYWGTTTTTNFPVSKLPIYVFLCLIIKHCYLFDFYADQTPT
jgi:hypothetical protein